MRKYEVRHSLKKVLKKISKKDKVAFEQVMGKIKEIISCKDIGHYKNLRAPLPEFKRVHIKTSFVLVFKCLKSEDKIIFYDFDHHDSIYNR